VENGALGGKGRRTKCADDRGGRRSCWKAGRAVGGERWAGRVLGLKSVNEGREGEIGANRLRRGPTSSSSSRLVVEESKIKRGKGRVGEGNVK